MSELHGLLARQVERHFGNLARAPGELSEFLDLVSDAYRGFDRDRTALEQALAAHTQELLQARGDLRSQVELEARLREQTAELARVKEVAEAADYARFAFLGSIGHELRTPLSSVIGFAELLAERVAGDLTAKQAQYVQIIGDSGRRLLALIDRILSLARVGSATSALDCTPVDIVSLVEGSLSLFKERCLRHRIRTSLEAREGAHGLIVSLDEPKIGRALFDLVSNALMLTPDEGQVRIELALLQEPGGTAGGGRQRAARLPAVQISVLDTYAGIPAEDLDRVFEAFQGIGGGTAVPTSGTGLGLSLVRHLVELHGGHAWAESEGEGGGNALRFTVPLAAEPKSAAAPAGCAEVRT